MSQFSVEQLQRMEKERIEKSNIGYINDALIDRWSIVFILMILSIVLFLLLVKKGQVKWAFAPIAVTSAVGLYVANSSARIRKNEFGNLIYGKGENDCGFSTDFNSKEIDGLLMPGSSVPQIYKTVNGTDLKVSKDGFVSPVGFGTRVINRLGNGGYQNEAPDDCWKVK